MDAEDAPRCYNCNAVMSYQGRISLPPQTIYRCKSCGVEVWADMRRPTIMPTDQPQLQQQQQPQPKPDKE